jgi:phage shock protein PspC (stress-responsive transcriptional regulator)
LKDQDEDDRRSQRSENSSQGSGPDFSQAMGRLEKAVQDLVTVTTGELGERATSVINETSKRLEAELRLKRATGDDLDTDEVHVSRRRKHRQRHRFSDDVEGHYSTLYIDKNDEKVAGVCSAFARYFGVESWVVRMGALTGLIFIPTIVFPGYWISYFVIQKKSSSKPKRVRSSRRSRRRRRQEATEEAKAAVSEAYEAEHAEEYAEESTPRATQKQKQPRRDKPQPSRDLRHVTTDLTQVELKLRRIESFVTSNQYELHKELHKIDNEGARV